MKEKFEKQYNELKENYKVNHLLNDNKEIMFVLESPHIDELLNQAPVSGLSGKAMSKVLFGDEEKTPLGIKLKKEMSSKIGIMNICSIPMQRAAYINQEVEKMYGKFDTEKYQTFFDVLEKLRTSTKLNYKEAVKNELQDIILNDFREELNKLKDKKLIIIPCGKTAETFFEAANVKNENWTIVKGVPHPSFGNWHKSKYSEKIKEVKDAIKYK